MGVDHNSVLLMTMSLFQIYTTCLVMCGSGPQLGTSHDYILISDLYDMLGNVWEWTTTRYFERVVDRKLQEEMYVLKGGSFLDSKDGSANHIVRNSQRWVYVGL